MPATLFGSACARRAATISDAVIGILQAGILHGEQEQPLGGGGGAGARGQRCHRGQVAAPGFEQGTHDIADDMFEETAAAHAVDQAPFGALQHRRENGAHLGFAIGVAHVGGGKGAEIVLAFEDAGEAGHALLVEGVGMMVHVGPLERATDFGAHDAVLVSFGHGIEARMKIGMHLLGRKHADGGRQQAVDGAPQIGQRDRVLDAERGHLGQRMDTGIGASAAGHVHRLALYGGNDFFQQSLYGGQTGLHLPAVKRAAVVGDMDTNAPHHAGREPGLTTGTPSRQSGHVSGLWAATCNVANATRGTPTAAAPPLRSIIEPAASTRAPAARRDSTTSRVLPPVVMTSSTTTAVSPGCTVNPRRSSILRVSGSRSVNRNGVPSARATSWPIISPPSAGDTTRATGSSRMVRISAAKRRPRSSAAGGWRSTRAHCR